MKKMAAQATFHCLLGCAIGELIGLELGRFFGLALHQTVILAVVLSFLSGYAMSTLPLVRGGMKFFPALRLVLAADTLSILTMTIVDTLVMVMIPGAMRKDPLTALYWVARSLSFAAAFAVAFPVNYALLVRGKGHALHHMHHDDMQGGHR